MLKIRTDDGFMEVPERFVGALTEIVQGQISDYLNDGILDVSDAPFSVVHEGIVRSATTDNYLPTGPETDFLLTLGINPFNFDHVDANAKNAWRKRAAFFINTKTDSPIEYPKIPVIVEKSDLINEDGSAPLQEDIDAAVIFLQDLMTEIATKNKLSPQVLPAQMHVYNDGISNSLSTKPVDNGPLNSLAKQACSKFMSLVRENADNPDNPALSAPAANVLKAYGHLIGSGSEPLSIDITPELFMMVVNALKVTRQPRVADEGIAEIKTMLKAAIGFPLTHELGHVIDYAHKGFHYPTEIHKQLTTAMNEHMYYAASLCTNQLEGMLQAFGAPKNLKAIKAMNHSAEIEAHYLGVILFLNAGLDPNKATSTFLDQVPESFTHPAEKTAKAIINLFFQFL